MDSPRHTRRDHRLRQPLERADTAPTGRLHPMDRHPQEPLLCLEEALRPAQRAQRQDPPRSLASRLGEEGHPKLCSGVSARRVSPSDLHDAGCRCGRGQPVQRVPGSQSQRPAQPLESNAIQEGLRLHPARGAPSALAHDPVWRTSPISTFAARSTTCARCWTAAAGSSCITSFGRR